MWIARARIWVSYWNTGQVGMYDLASRAWREWTLPGNRPQAYSVWVDDKDKVWLTEWTANAIVRLIRRPKRSRPIRRTAPARRCDRCWVARAKRGVPDRAPND